MLVLLALTAPGQYCLQNVTPAGLALDRASNREMVSVAASGFAMVNWALSLPREEAAAQGQPLPGLDPQGESGPQPRLVVPLHRPRWNPEA